MSAAQPIEPATGAIAGQAPPLPALPRIARSPLSTPVFVVGYPGDVGGAHTECWHTVRLWRRFGLQVQFIPTWNASEPWRQRLAALGCPTLPSRPDRLGEIPGLRQAVVVAFCNRQFLRHAETFRRLRCRIVWVGCMTWLFPEERKHYRRFGPFDRYVFQSRYQHEELLPQLAKFGVKAQQCRLIRGAFCWDEFPYSPKPHPPQAPFVIGRLSRPAADKYSCRTWEIYARIRPPRHVRVMGWDEPVEAKLGPPPAWAQCLPAGAETPQQFLASLHCLLPINGGAAENWPRAGLEAMASGVPIVAENRWGWREMIRHGQTGYLADTDEQLADYAQSLAEDESHRLAVALAARKSLEDELASPQALWSSWRELLEGL